MSKGPWKSREHQSDLSLAGYDAVLGEITKILESARRTTARTVNAIMTATYCEIGR